MRRDLLTFLLLQFGQEEPERDGVGTLLDALVVALASTGHIALLLQYLTQHHPQLWHMTSHDTT